MKVFVILNEDWSNIINIEIIELTKILKHSWKKKEWPQLRKKTDLEGMERLFTGALLWLV